MDLRRVAEPIGDSACCDGQCHEGFVYPSPIHTPLNMPTDHQSQVTLVIAIIFNVTLASPLIALQDTDQSGNVLFATVSAVLSSESLDSCHRHPSWIELVVVCWSDERQFGALADSSDSSSVSGANR
jgi:hypothetical protein